MKDIATADEIRDLYRFHKNQLDELSGYLADLRKRYIFLKYGIKVGSQVKGTRDGKIYKVAIIRGPTGCNGPLDKPWIIVNQQKKDGTFGSVNHDILSDWELVKTCGD